MTLIANQGTFPIMACLVTCALTSIDIRFNFFVFLSMPAANNLLTQTFESPNTHIWDYGNQNFQFTMDKPPKTIFISVSILRMQLNVADTHHHGFNRLEDVFLRFTKTSCVELLFFFDEMLGMSDMASVQGQDGLSLDQPLNLDCHATPSQWTAYMSFMYPPQ
jgi:hypothetical protein